MSAEAGPRAPRRAVPVSEAPGESPVGSRGAAARSKILLGALTVALGLSCGCGGGEEPGPGRPHGDAHAVDVEGAPDGGPPGPSGRDARDLGADEPIARGLDARPGSAPEAGPGPGSARTSVLVITIDGLRADAIAAAPAPAIEALARRGSSTLAATTVTPSLTVPAHASLVTGYEIADHGLTWDEERFGKIAVPTLFTAATAAGFDSVVAFGKRKLRQIVPNGTAYYATGDDHTDEEMAGIAADAITKRPWRIVLVQLADVDTVGHRAGWMSEAYLAQVRATDAVVAKILAATPPDFAVLLTSDHGGSMKAHTAGTAEDLTIPWILSGPGIKKGHTIKEPVSLLDGAQTVAHLTGLTLGPKAKGQVVPGIFEGR